MIEGGRCFVCCCYCALLSSPARCGLHLAELVRNCERQCRVSSARLQRDEGPTDGSVLGGWRVLLDQCNTKSEGNVRSHHSRISVLRMTWMNDVASLPWSVKLNKGGIPLPLESLMSGFLSSSKNEWTIASIGENRFVGVYSKRYGMRANASVGVFERKICRCHRYE